MYVVCEENFVLYEYVYIQHLPTHTQVLFARSYRQLWRVRVRVLGRTMMNVTECLYKKSQIHRFSV